MRRSLSWLPLFALCLAGYAVPRPPTSEQEKPEPLGYTRAGAPIIEGEPGSGIAYWERVWPRRTPEGKARPLVWKPVPAIMGGAGSPRYWVGGTGTWNASNTGNWAASSGGASGASAPTSSDSAIVDTNSGNGTITIASGAACADLAVNWTAVKTNNITLSANFTVAGNVTINGNSLTNRILVQSSATGTARTFTCNGTVSISNIDLMDITGAGSGTWSGTSIGNALGCSGITFTPAVTRYAYAGATKNWSSTTMWDAVSTTGGGGASVPLPQDTAIFDSGTGAGTYTADMPRLCADLICTGFTRTLTTSVTHSIYGSVTLSAGMTWTQANATVLMGRSSHTLTSAGQVFAVQISSNATGGTFTLQDALTITGTNGLAWAGGTITGNGFNVTTTKVNTNVTSTGAKTFNMGAGTWALTGTGTVWDATGGGGVTINASTSIIDLTNTTATAKTFAGGGKTYSTLRYNVNSAASLTITGANTFTSLTNSIPVAGSARTMTLPASTTTTVTNLTMQGTGGARLTVNSSTGGTAATISTSTAPVVDHVTMQDITLTGAGSPGIAALSTNTSNNTGWTFTLGSGTAVGASTVSGAIAATRPLAGAAVGQGVASGAVKVSRPLAGAAAGISSAQGGPLTIHLGLAGTSQGQALVTGGMYRDVPLIGFVHGAGVADGALAVERPLAGIATGQGTGQGIAQVARELSGTVQGEGDGESAMQVLRSLAVLVAGEAEVSAEMNVQEITIIVLKGLYERSIQLQGSYEPDIELQGSFRGS